MTIWALIINEMKYVNTGKVLLGIVNIIIIAIVIIVSFESIKSLTSTKMESEN